tara:strand:+ start:1210 stop:1341 length:132 start_codon:yes stop_codon:yes gene_type:complete
MNDDGNAKPVPADESIISLAKNLVSPPLASLRMIDALIVLPLG